MNCHSCGAELPADARFCIECGRALALPATDATVRLPAAQAALVCRSCGALSPTDAAFCVRCGQSHGDQAHARLDAPTALAPSPHSFGSPRRSRRGGRAWRGGRHIPAIFLIGLGLMILTGKALFWPGILILFSVGAFVREARRGRPAHALSALVWALGMLVAFMLPRLFFPAILLTIGATVLLHAARRP